MPEIFFVADPDPDKLREALIAALRKERPSKAVCDEVARMLDPAGHSKFKLSVSWRKDGNPRQCDEKWFARYRRAEEIFYAIPDEETALDAVEDKVRVSRVTAKKYRDFWEEQRRGGGKRKSLDI